jgi:hypothetical protein
MHVLCCMHSYCMHVLCCMHLFCMHRFETQPSRPAASACIARVIHACASVLPCTHLNMSVHITRYIPPMTSSRPRAPPACQEPLDAASSANTSISSDWREVSGGSTGWREPSQTSTAREALTWLEEYASWHNSIMANEASQSTAQYVIARHFPTSGLGNLLQSLVSSFLLAVLTNRVFLHDSLLIHRLVRFPQLQHVDFADIHSRFGAAHVASNAQYVIYRGQDWMLCDDIAHHLTQKVSMIYIHTYIHTYIHIHTYI